MTTTTKQMTTNQQAAVSTSSMRAEADQRSAAAREATRLAWQAGLAARAEAGKAEQLAWEAGLIDAAAAAMAEHDKAEAKLPALEAKVTEALAAERDAEDLLNSDRKRLARRTGELEKARADRAGASVREDLAVRIRELALIVSEDEEGRDEAKDERVQAEAALAAAQAQVTSLYAAWAEASRQADNPGPAPREPGALDALGEIGKSVITTMATLAVLAGDPAPAKPDRAALMRDQTRFRALNSNVIVPPRMPT
jgi:hypothetical protein